MTPRLTSAKIVAATVLMAVALSLLSLTSAARTRTTRPEVGKKNAAKTTIVEGERMVDTISYPDTKAVVAVKGFSKPLRSRIETFFVTNTSENPADTIVEIVLTFNYVDLEGRQLHRTTHKVKETIPPGETRQLTVPSWDRQLTFYYVHGKAGYTPRNVTPFDVAIRPDTVYIRQHTTNP